MTDRYIGSSLLRTEGKAKVRGQSTYIDDMTFPGLWHGITVRSTVPRGRILGIEFLPGVPWEEFVVVRASDISGPNHLTLILDDQPVLADTMIHHQEEAVVLLAHPKLDMLRQARDLVKVVVERLDPVLSIDEALAKKLIVWGDDNIFKSYTINKGDVDSCWNQAAFVVEGEYHTGAQEQLYIEPQGMVATYDDNEGVTVWGSLQCPFYIHKALKALFAFTDDAKIRIIQAETGGGFGGKEEYPSMIAAHAALLAKKAQRPVKIIYDRAEDMAATTKRHPSRTTIKTALASDGRIIAQDINFILDGGAYATLSAVVLSRGTIHAPGPYDVANVRVRSSVVATNTPPHGAFRGFGAPQSIFAMERHLDVIARKIGMDPVDLRKKNLLKTGSTTATGQLIKERIDLDGMLEAAMKEAKFREKRRDYDATNQSRHLKRGIGLALFMHGAGFTGSGERYLASKLTVEATVEGGIRILSSSTEIGQGTNTIFTQIAADAMGLPASVIEVIRPDTAIVPNSGPTVASRTVMIVGKLVEDACRSLRARIAQHGPWLLGDTAAFASAVADLHAHDPNGLRETASYQAPSDIYWDDQAYQGDAYATYAWAVYIADVVVDPDSFEIKVEDFVAMQDIGKVVHPVLAAGQVEGGVAQAIGFALSEQVVWADGKMANNSMTNYIMPTAVDVPPIRVFFKSWATTHGPGGGAKGVGELPLDGAAPAILNAVNQAMNVRATEVPYLPENLLRDLQT